MSVVLVVCLLVGWLLFFACFFFFTGNNQFVSQITPVFCFLFVLFLVSGPDFMSSVTCTNYFLGIEFFILRSF